MIKINQNSESRFFSHQHKMEVLKYALKLAQTGKLRTILNSGKEIAYWYAPEINKGKPQISSSLNNECKTVSIVKESKDNLTDAEYSEFVDQLTELTKEEKIDNTDLFVILQRKNEESWVPSLNKKGNPYTYTNFDAAARSVNRLVKNIQNEKNSEINAFKIVKYSPKKIDFEKALFIGSFFALETSENKYLGPALTPVDSVEKAITFDGNSTGELDAQNLAKLYNAKIAYFEIRKLWKSK